jgi:hypothetical protein
MEIIITTTPAEVIPAGPRKALIVQNAGSADILLAPRANVAASGAHAGLVLAPGESLALGALPGSAHNVAHAALHAVATEGSQALRWEEWL